MILQRSHPASPPTAENQQQIPDNQENSYASFSDANFGFLDWSTLGHLQ